MRIVAMQFIINDKHILASTYRRKLVMDSLLCCLLKRQGGVVFEILTTNFTNRQEVITVAVVHVHLGNIDQVIFLNTNAWYYKIIYIISQHQNRTSLNPPSGKTMALIFV